MGSREATTKATIAILLVLVVVLASTTAYYGYAMADANARASSIQKSAADLQYRNDELQRLLAVAQSRQNSTVAGLNPVSIYDSSNRSVVTIQGSRAVSVLTLFGPQNTIESVLGSGFVVEYSNSDYVVTNFHVVDSMVNVTVTFWNGDAYGAKVIGADPNSDLAVLSTEASESDLHPLGLTSSSFLMVGQPVVAIGNPFGLSGSVTFGIISQLGRTIQYQSTSSTFSIADVIQFSAPINPGNSGGPLLDANGFVVGITSAAVTGSQGVGFAIPSDAILRELPSLIQAGKYASHPYLGIQAVDMNYQLAQAMRTSTTYGVLIETIAPSGPADKANLKGGRQVVTIGTNQYMLGGDIIVSVNGTRIVNYDALATYLEEYTVPGQTVQVGIVRSGNQIVVSLVVGSLPSQ
jgi:S1-C subfamily serine protease